MTVYNGGTYLKSSISSVLRQTFDDFEFLIIDDASTDDSLETMKSFQDERIVIHRNEQNCGQTKSLNIGLGLAKGKYVARIDADDGSYPEWLEVLFRFMQFHPECAVVGASVAVMDATGRTKRILRKPTAPAEIQFYFLYDTPVVHGSVLMRRDIILKCGGYDEAFRFAQDYELWSALMREGECILNVSDVLTVIRHYQDSMCLTNMDRLVVESATTLKSNSDAMSDSPLSLDEAIHVRHLFMFPESMTSEDFIKAESRFKEQYRRLKPRYAIDSRLLQKQIKKVMAKAYTKLAIAEVRRGCTHKVRELTALYHTHYGYHPMVRCLHMLSYTHKSLLTRIPVVYEAWREWTLPRVFRGGNVR